VHEWSTAQLVAGCTNDHTCAGPEAQFQTSVVDLHMPSWHAAAVQILVQHVWLGGLVDAPPAPGIVCYVCMAQPLHMMCSDVPGIVALLLLMQGQGCAWCGALRVVHAPNRHRQH
jgi:hypothetical protein